MASTGGPRRIVLHVGLHKTGTTYLQGLWSANRDQLAAQGIHFPGGPTEPVQRLASYDLLGKRPRGVDDLRLPGQWQALVDTVTASEHPVVLLSEEGLSVSTPKQVAAAVSSFPEREVHVLVTVRDLGRVLVSAWQEDIKNDRSWTWDEFVAGVQQGDRARNPARGFWRAQDLPAILSRWVEAVPADRIHVVTVPPAGAQRALLLERVAGVIGFDPDGLTQVARWDNASLGTAGTEVVRRLNVLLDHRLNQRQHGYLVKDLIVPFLVRSGGDAPYGLPPEEVPWITQEAARHIEVLQAKAYHLVGDLDDLLPRTSSAMRRPDDASVDELLEAALLALEGLSERHAKLWWRVRKSDQPVVIPASRRVRLESAARSVQYRTRRAGADLADRNTFAARLLDSYLRRGSGTRPPG